jgi:cytochrome P450
MSFAWMMGTLALATVGRRWRFRSVDDRPVERLARSITLRPRRPLLMRVERR